MPTETNPTEAQARTLLARAAATIDVDESAPITLTGLPEPSRRRWPVLVAAAAAVVAAIGGGYAVARQFGDDPAPKPGPVADREPVEQEHVYALDQVPSVLGYTRAEAVDLLSDRGLDVDVQSWPSCQPQGIAVGTVPATGTHVDAGAPITLRISSGSNDSAFGICQIDERSWQRVVELIRIARGLRPAPDFPEGVSIAVGEGRFVHLTPSEAADPENWVLCEDGECHSALAALEEMVTRPVEMDGLRPATFLVATDDPRFALNAPEPVCLTPDPYEQFLTHHPATYVYVDHSVDGIRLCPPPPVVQIEWTKDRHIASVRLRLGLPEEAEPGDPTEPTSERVRAAEAFAAWARGNGPAPEFAERVRHLAPGFTERWNSEPEIREGWSGCSGLGFPDCAIDPVGALYRYRGEVVATAGLSSCPAGGVAPGWLASAEDDVIRLSEPEPAGCAGSWAVELWIDRAGEIYAVRQLGAPR